MSVLIRGNPKAATVVGNITTGAIEMSGALGAPWDVLNVRA